MVFRPLTHHTPFDQRRTDFSQKQARWRSALMFAAFSFVGKSFCYFSGIKHVPTKGSTQGQSLDLTTCEEIPTVLSENRCLYETLLPTVTMALKQHRTSQQYSYRRKVYVGKGKKQGSDSQGIMAQMMYYSKSKRGYWRL